MASHVSGGSKANNTYDKTQEGDKLGGLVGLGSHEDYLKEQAEKNRPKTRWERKMDRIFGEAKAIRQNFFMGFLMGGCVGGAFGALSGTYFAIQYKQFSLIPLMACTSGGTFGFFMGVGAVMRSADQAEKIESEDQDYMIRTYNAENGHMTYHAFYNDLKEIEE